MKMLFTADGNGWPLRLVSETHEGPAPAGHVAFDDLRAMVEWQEAHPELVPPRPPDQIPVPEEVFSWALREICLDRGHTEEIEAAFARLDPKTATKARNRWLSKQTLSRDSEYIVTMQKLLRWTDDYVNDLFQAAAAL